MALKTKIKQYREAAGYKQSELAEMVGARRETIVHLENGKYNPSLKLAMDIAKVFHKSVEELFEFDEE
jgi:predicted transcriptional regulators